MEIFYRIASISDLDTITKLSALLYCGDYSEKLELDELYVSNKEDLLNPHMAMFIAFDSGKAVGFSHVLARHEYVIGTESSPVGYLEGVYVCPDYRSNDIAKTLVNMCENWSRERGCAEFASDCELGNSGSLAFHLKVGFEESSRIIFFKKKL